MAILPCTMEVGQTGTTVLVNWPMYSPCATEHVGVCTNSYTRGHVLC